MADKEPYGDVTYADPGYQDDGKKRYPIDTEEHCRAAWSYINQSRNAAKYTSEQVTAIKKRIKAAGKKFGLTFEQSNQVTPIVKNRWYSLTNLATGTAELAIYDEIGGWGINAQQMAADLEQVSGRDLTLRMNSKGGDVFEGIAIHSALRRHSGKVTCVVDSLAASIASAIAMAADEVLMTPHAKIMIHDAMGEKHGNAAEMRKFTELLDQTSETIAGIYAEHTGGSQADWRARMVAETWFNATEAVDAGLADAIVTSAADLTPTNSFSSGNAERKDSFDYASVVAALRGAGHAEG